MRLLEDADYRLIRNHDDLLECVAEVLDKVAEDVPADLSMLYGKRSKRRNSLPKRLNEDALQAYVRRRLTDLLPPRIQGFKGCIVREDQVGYRRRLDLRVMPRACTRANSQRWLLK